MQLYKYPLTLQGSGHPKSAYREADPSRCRPDRGPVYLVRITGSGLSG